MKPQRRYFGIAATSTSYSDEVAARGVEDRGLVGDALGDDAVARLGRDDVAGGDEVFVAQARCRRGETR